MFQNLFATKVNTNPLLDSKVIDDIDQSTRRLSGFIPF